MSCVHRRDLDCHQHDAQPWSLRQGRAPAEPMVLDGPINGDWFEAYVPELRPGDVVIMDNLSSHKRASVQAHIEAAGATLRFLPPYSPDFNPIEKAFSGSRRCCAKQASEPSAAFGTSSASSSTSSNPTNAPGAWFWCRNPALRGRRGLTAMPATEGSARDAQPLRRPLLVAGATTRRYGSCLRPQNAAGSPGECP